jgi:20S proteasome alpha/beta subunit
LKQDYKEDCDLKEACGIAVKVLSKTMDSTNLSSEKSMFPLQLVGWVYTFNTLIVNMLDLFPKLHPRSS